MAQTRGWVASGLRLLPQASPGKARLARLVLGRVLAAHNVEARDRYGCTYLVPSLREPMGFHLLIDGGYEVDSLEVVLANVATGSVFVDVGACIGLFTSPVAKRVGASGTVVAVEASEYVLGYVE